MGHGILPFSREQLLEDVSFQGEGPKVDDLLHGNYDFPDDCPEPARVLCRVAAKISKYNRYKESTTSITTKTLQDW